jgi:hypothetical protein
MAYRNKYDKDGSSFDLGSNAESSFVIAAQKSDMKVAKSSRSEEFSHIDFHIEVNGLKLSVEVKSRKKVKRGDSNVNDDLIWIEFKNVRGMRGWLYGSAEVIAFERENDFLMVNRKHLARLAEKLCDLTKINTHTKMPLYTGYQRRDRNDLLSLIKMEDITQNIKYSLLPK